ncbi:astacin-like metalloendopeptidase [Penaeus chinensis]|uniref:astacin-like metalloendopeptidase n=1 Tax=Penaeus chinensis TaxID=139456 RepID=UPI001FB5CC92|nr:astacin-like metalloendopeptidase [Penaeus chinensis]
MARFTFIFIFLLSVIGSRGIDIERAEFLSGIAVGRWNPDLDVNPEELGIYQEGDLRNDPRILLDNRNVIANPELAWPDARVPYEIHPDFSKKERRIILQAMYVITSHTCVKFVKRTTEEGYLSIGRNATGCWSHIGYLGGRQWLNYQDRCLWRFGTVVHELFHTLGLFHEQSRPDRDNFVKVKWDNIKSGYHHNFLRLGNKRATTLGVDYNYASVMHYSPKAFSKDKKKLTIVPKMVNHK